MSMRYMPEDPENAILTLELATHSAEDRLRSIGALARP